MVDGGYSCAEVQTLTIRHLADIRTKIADLRVLEDTLEKVSDQCTGDTAPACPVIEALLNEQL
jgi:MerR family mercuric resistance operon transcriptional regulator